ncbi:MAG: NAD(P)H-dependent oxidoreductase subunit E [Dehalococcoidia bacterium]|nr:NAD(P)H-dependent oxidoreductase subunit E [Dehalococcoidia bacterium]
MATVEIDKVDKILDKYEGRKGGLIQILLDIQSEFNWIPLEAMDRISRRFKIPMSQVYRVVSFYKAMSLTPRGRHLLRVCLGTACHVRGGRRIMEKTQELLGLQGAGTTQDLKFTLERVNCLGCCALGPVMVANGEYHGHMTASEVGKILETCE